MFIMTVSSLVLCYFSRLWGYINKKLSGLILPARRPDQSIDDAEDEAIQLLIDSSLKELIYNNHPVVSVHVPCTSSIVNIGGELYENDYIEEEETSLVQRIMEDKKMDKKKLRETYPNIYGRLKTILKHVDSRLHGYIFRKCHPKESNCSYCRETPRRGSSQLWSCLPKKSSGGLFFDCEVDKENPGHFRTLLDLLKDGEKIKINPDGILLDLVVARFVSSKFTIFLPLIQYFTGERLSYHIQDQG